MITKITMITLIITGLLLYRCCPPVSLLSTHDIQSNPEYPLSLKREKQRHNAALEEACHNLDPRSVLASLMIDMFSRCR